MTNHIEKIIVDKNDVVISGWALGKSSKSGEIQIVLKATDNTDSYLLNTVQSEDAALNNYFAEKWNCGQARFNGKIERKELKHNTCYEIVLFSSFEQLLDTQKELYEIELSIRTGRYIYNEKLYSYDPTRIELPFFADEYMNEVIKKGECCLYREKEDMYVYKYEGLLYWIAGERFEFHPESKTYISYQIGTTWKEKLKESRQIYEFENMDFYFEEQEIQIEDSAGYRVAVRELPKGFPELYFLTGKYDLDNKTFYWRERIYPSYDFLN